MRTEEQARIARIRTGEMATGSKGSTVVRTYKPTSKEAKERAESAANGKARDAYEDRSIPVSSATDAEMRREWLADQCISIRQREDSRRRRVQGTSAAINAAVYALTLGVGGDRAAEYADAKREAARSAAIARTYNGRDPRLAEIESRPVHPQTRLDRAKEVSKNTR